MKSEKRTVGALLAGAGKALCYLLLFLLMQTLFSLAYTLTAQIYATLNPGSGIDPIELVLACTDQISLLSGAATLIFLAVFFLLRRKNPLKECGFLATRGRQVFMAAGLAPILYLATTLILGALPQEWLEDYMEASAALNDTGLLMMLATVIFAPLVEEIVFRGLVLTRLRRGMPGWLAVLITALAFGVCHGQIVWIAYAFVLGTIFGFMALRARSIWPSLTAHLIFNGIGHLSAVLEDRALDPWPFLLAAAGAGFLLFAATLIFALTHPVKKAQADT